MGSCGEREVGQGGENSEGGYITVNIKVNTSNGANVLNFSNLGGKG